MRGFVQGFGVVVVSFGLLSALFYGGWFLEQKRDMAEVAPRFLRAETDEIANRATRALLLGLFESAAAVAVGALATLLLAKRNRPAAVAAVAAGALAAVGVVAGSCLPDPGPLFLPPLAHAKTLARALAYAAPVAALALAGAGYFISRPEEPALEEARVGT